MHPMDYDFIVIGAGSGGIAAARRASQHGAKVLLIECKKVGGTCVNVGCVPKKVSSNLCQILLDSRQLHKSYSLKRKFSSANTTDSHPEDTDLSLFVDYPMFKANRDSYITRLNNIYHKILQNDKNITYMEGTASVFKNHVELNDKKYTFRYCLLATGSKSKELVLCNDENFDCQSGENLNVKEFSRFIKTSDDFFALSCIPKNVVVIGSGYIGIEIATILHSLGSHITLIARNTKLLSHFDDILGENICHSMINQGIKIMFESNIVSIKDISSKNSESQIEPPRSENHTMEGSKNTEKMVFCDVYVKQKNETVCISNVDFIMCAIGRDCDLSYIKEPIKEKSTYLQVDGNFETSIKNIYAVGDLLGPPYMLTPYAIYCGRLLSDHLFKKRLENIADTFQIKRAVPSVIFSHPPCASIGLSEKEAREKSENVQIHESTFSNMLFCFQDAEEKEKSKFKIITIDNKVVGLHLFGTGSDEIIQGFAVAIKMGATYDDFKNTVPVHPTAAEEVITMK